MNDTNSSTLTYGRWSADANMLPPKAVAYLLHNGFTQSMTDAAAFTKDQKAKAVEGHAEADHEAILATMQDEARQKRFDAILAGTVGIRVGGPRLDPVERTMREIADEMLAAIVAERKVAAPKGDVRKTAIEKILAKHGADIRTRAEARIADSASLAADLDDVLA